MAVSSVQSAFEGVDEELEQPVLSFLNGEEGWDTNYSSISEFKHHLKEDSLADEELEDGWVFWRENEQQLNNTTHLQHKITTLFKHRSSSFERICFYMAQFWGVVKVEGRRHYLSAFHHPFSVSDLRKGFCWYRNLCRDHVYPVEMDGTVEEAQLGGVGRAYRNKHPESTPDLRLYSTNEFPLRDHAARCGFRSYLALPLFDLHTNECCGVVHTNLISSLTEQLQIAGLRSTHINFNRITYDKDIMAVMDGEYEERVLPFLRRQQGWDDEYSISEFKHHLDEADLMEEKLELGWVLWHHSNHTTQIQDNIILLLKHIASMWFETHFLVQFWAAVEVEGRHHYLSTSNQPFFVGKLRKGLCWYRKQCMDHDMYDVVVDVAEITGRAYRNKKPESTPDLRLYSTDEFPLRDHAARCGLIGYLALPLFDLNQNQCYGVLELLSDDTPMRSCLLSSLNEGLQIAGLRSTHTNFIPISRDTEQMPYKYKRQQEREIAKLLKSCVEAVPQLHLAQVWVPCMQCAYKETILCCMERATFINSQDKAFNLCNDIDEDMFDYLQASEFHNIQIDLSCLHHNLCDISISKKPFSQYADRARLSSSFAICLESGSNSLCVIEFFLEPKCREDAFGDSIRYLLLKIMVMGLKDFKFVPEAQIQEELAVLLRQPNAMDCEYIDMLKVTKANSYMETLSSELDFIKYMETVDLCCIRPSSVGSDEGWVFGQISGNTVNGDSLLLPVPVKEKIEYFMKKIAVQIKKNYNCIVQFWAPKVAEGRCYLETSAQPYALGCLAKGLASFRKECMKHHYFVDDEAKEEELGPPGRVFRNKHPEITPDLFLYSTKEFSMRNYAMHCCLREYFALPVFNELNHEGVCVGVLEFIGFSYSELQGIGRVLEAAKLSSTHVDFRPRFIANHQLANITNCRKQALTEVREFLMEIEISKIPQLHMVNVWVPNGNCASIDSELSCMELALSTRCIWQYMPTNWVHWIHVHTRKGVVGIVLASNNKSCFFQDLSNFSIIDQPLAHYERRERRDVCFAICLQSSHTGDLIYVLEFFLNHGPITFKHLQSFFNFLVPIMKKQLKSFNIASGKQLGEEIVVDVIQFSDANTLASYDVFPVHFNNIQYDQEEYQYDEEDDHDQHHQRHRIIRLEDLRPHFGKRLQDVAKEFGGES